MLEKLSTQKEPLDTSGREDLQQKAVSTEMIFTLPDGIRSFRKKKKRYIMYPKVLSFQFKYKVHEVLGESVTTDWLRAVVLGFFLVIICS